jgi:hypothetical protein
VAERLASDLGDMERVTGIEPASSAWEAEALPLDDTRIFVARQYQPKLKADEFV